MALSHELDIRFLFCDSGRVFGIDSRLGAQLERLRLELGPSTYVHNETAEVDAEALERFARAYDALFACAPLERIVLRAYYASDSYLTREEQRKIGPAGLLGAVMILVPELDAWAREQRDYGRGKAHDLESLILRAGKGSAGAASALARVRLRADERLVVACEAYERHADSKHGPSKARPSHQNL